MERVENKVDRHRGLIVGTIIAVHFVLTVAMFFLSLASGMSRFDGAGPSDLTHFLVNGAFQVLSFPLFPLVPLLKIDLPGAWGWLGFLANSALWGWAGWSAIRARANGK